MEESKGLNSKMADGEQTAEGASTLSIGQAEFQRLQVREEIKLLIINNFHQ